MTAGATSNPLSMAMAFTLANHAGGRGFHASAGNRGVILMETILVLPILLMLLGGLFVVGDLMMSRLAAHEIDRALAWRAVDRFGPTDFERRAFLHLLGPQGIVKKPKLAAYEATGSGLGNRWSSVFGGRSDVRVDVPWWTAFMDVQDVVMGDPENPDRMESTYNLFSDEEGNFTKTPRAYVFRRLESTNGGERSRHPSGFPWKDICGDKLVGVPVNDGWTGGKLGAYNRNPNAIVVSGDPGP